MFKVIASINGDYTRVIPAGTKYEAEKIQWELFNEGIWDKIAIVTEQGQISVMYR